MITRQGKVRTPGRWAVVFVTTLSVCVGIGGMSASAAPNDPGFCGVRDSGPIHAGSEFVYGVYNKCGYAYTWKVYLPSVGRYAVGSSSGKTCQSDPAYIVSYYYAPAPDPNWYILNC